MLPLPTVKEYWYPLETRQLIHAYFVVSQPACVRVVSCWNSGLVIGIPAKGFCGFLHCLCKNLNYVGAHFIWNYLMSVVTFIILCMPFSPWLLLQHIHVMCFLGISFIVARLITFVKSAFFHFFQSQTHRAGEYSCDKSATWSDNYRAKMLKVNSALWNNLQITIWE
jgi:hypothetical protein